ncbi:MAG: InlB B-repeat-containing protein [Candidatus Saccharibacteria bacterium]|nr:InlB B-repeat-containing protein [Candidatus Saccharibacteria bacterium]
MIKKNAGGVLLATLLLSFAFFSLNTFAAQGTLVGGEVNVVAGVEPVLRISLPNNITIKIDPGSKDPYTVPVKLNIYTNNPDGYFSSITTNKNRANAEDTSATSLIHKDNSDYKIDPLAASTTFDGFPAGYWGYSVDGGKTFSSVPAANDTPAETNTDAGLYFGVKVPEFQASGMYSNTIVVAAVTRHVLSQDELFDGIQYMQDMTQQICETENAGMAKQLTDRRDGKRYWVTKMRDNNCWMTQNLDFELSSEGTTLTPSDSNVFATKTIYKEDARGGNDIFYMDGGDYYVPNGDGYDDNGNPTSTAELTSDSLDWHYHVGSIYSWPAATAGSGTSDVYIGEADESICPKGWRLPIGTGRVLQNRNYSFFKLFTSQPEALSTSDSDLGGFYIKSVGVAPFYFMDARNIYEDVNYDVMPFLPESYWVGDFMAYRRNTSYLFSYWTSTALPQGYNISDSYQGMGWSEYTNQNAMSYLANETRSYNTGILSAGSNESQSHRNFGALVRCVSAKKDLYSISTMQEMTQEIVSNTDTEAAKQLIDVRDGKKYWVTKENDGNIWMTQNLDFALSTSGTQLNPETSNVTETKTITAEPSFGNDKNGIYYLDEGDMYYYYGNSSWGNYDMSNSGNSLEYFDGKQSDAGHGRVGDFYSWNAATAGSGARVENEGDNAKESICPKGWQLPTNGGQNDMANASYDNLIKQFAAMDDRTKQQNYYEAYYYNSQLPVSNPPLYLHYTGEVNELGEISDSGSLSAFWSSRLKSRGQTEDYAYQLRLTGQPSVIYSPSDNNIRKSTYGAKVRCVAAGSRKYSLSYNANGGMNAPSIEYGLSIDGAYTFTISNNVPIRAGLQFRGWSTNPDAMNGEYQPGSNATFSHGTTILYAIWGPKLTITFDANGGSGLMESQTIESGTAKTLRKNTYRRTGGYRFIGWSINRNAETAEYPNSGMYSVPVIEHDTTITLYAIWEHLDQDPMQGFDCSTLASGSTMELIDTRDNSIYTVAKLADGKCWMTENMRLDFSALEEDISAENTNNPTNAFMSAANTRPNSSSSWCTGWDASCLDQVTYNSDNLNNISDIKYGIYYNWYTATAGNGTSNTTYGSISGDLCPAGWHITTGGYNDSGDFATLNNILNGGDTGEAASVNLRSSPNNFTLSGYYYDTSVRDRGEYGYLWTSTPDGSGYAYHIYLSNTYLSTGSWDANKYYGYPIRCLKN